jgi:PAS domain S-box-containing protein
MSTIPDLIWLKDEHGKYLYCNSRFEDFFGASEKEIIGKTDYDFVDKELADFFARHDRTAIAEGVSSRNEEEITFASDGHREILETIKTPMYQSDGTLIGVLGIGRDITERKD